MHKILVVDDDKITHAFVKRALISKYDITGAFSGAEGLAAIAKDSPDVVLLDVEMPGMNGYEVCEQIKSNPKTADLPVIFLSGRDQLRDRMQGFEVGADDYIVKPFHPEDLVSKLNVIIQYRTQRSVLVSQVDEARRTAFMAISSSSDLGQAIQFIEKTHSLVTYEQLARAFWSVTRAMDLNCTVMINVHNQRHFFSSTHNSVSPMESELIAKAAEGPRFFDFGCRTQINYPHISLLIKNMPLDDKDRYGRIKDFFPAMLTTADTKVTQIHAQSAAKHQFDETQNAFYAISETLNNIRSGLQVGQKQGIKIMRAMLMDLDKKLPTMALDEDQEQYILDRVDKTIEEVHRAISETQELDNHFQLVLERLQTLLSHQEALQQLFMESSAAFDFEQDTDEDDGYQMDIELF